MTFLDVLTHLFLPQDSNNHRPKILHPHAYLFYIVFFLFFGMSVKMVHRFAPNILGVATNISVTDLLNYTNQKRTEAGLAPLSLSSQLSAAAAGKASDMFKNNYWAHFSPNGKSPWDFIVGSGYRYSYAGENLAKDFNDSAGVVNAWMASSSHRDNIVKPEYKDIGFAIVNGTLNGQETTLVVQMFGAGQGSNVVAQTNNIQPSPTPTIMVATEVTPVEEFKNIYIAGVKTLPLINIKSLNKGVTLLLLGILIIVLTLDGFIIWQRKTIRISGHNFAHIIFFAALITAIWLTGAGAII